MDNFLGWSFNISQKKPKQSQVLKFTSAVAVVMHLNIFSYILSVYSVV